MESLTVYKSVFPKKRCGNPNGDGGYVIATCLTYDYFISCGISDDITFEKDFLEMYPTIKCSAFDGTIDTIPENIENLTFIKKNISYYNDENTTNIHDILTMYSNIMLKMDIETYEFRFLQTLSTEHLKNIKQLVIEFHFPFSETNFTNLDSPLPIYQKIECLKKLSQTHYLIHFKPNTACGKILYNDVVVPNVFECTYIRKDVQQNIGLNSDSIPSTIDRKNRTTDEEFYIDYPPFVNK